MLGDFESGRLEGIYESGGREYDLAQTPIPRFDLLDPRERNRLTIQTQRGCPWRCEFCASSILLSSRYKLKPVHKVRAEIREIKRIWAEPFIELADDNTFVNKAHSRELVQAIGEENVSWFTETDVSVSDDLELLGLGADAGCAEVLIGFESPTASGLDGIELRRNWKHKSPIPIVVQSSGSSPTASPSTRASSLGSMGTDRRSSTPWRRSCGRHSRSTFRSPS